MVNGATPSIGGTNTTFKYQASGTEQAPFGLSLNDLNPQGVAANAAGTTEWVVDANKNVYVYSTGGTLLGSWSAGGLSSSAQLTGIATNGTDIWLVDSYADKVYKYTGAASRLSGSQNAASSFSLASGKNGNTNPQDIVTDGTSFWVVDGTALKVFKYTLSGSSLGSWSHRPGKHASDRHHDRSDQRQQHLDRGQRHGQGLPVHGRGQPHLGQPERGGDLRPGAGNTNPQGIADPPPADTLLVPRRAAAPIAVPSVGPSTIPSLASRDMVFALLSTPTASPTFGTERVGLPSGAPIAPVPLTAPASGSSPAFYLGGVTVGVPAGTSTDDNSLEAAKDSIFAGLADDAMTEE